MSKLARYDEDARECQMNKQWSGPNELQCNSKSVFTVNVR